MLNTSNSLLLKSKQQGSSFPDLVRGNDFFRLFLDPTMTWSGAYFQRDGMDLEEAQLAKYERLCRQLRLSHHDHVLEMGCGWGGYAIYMARNYGCKVTAITISEEEQRLAAHRVEAAGLGHLVTIRLQDYRELSGQFDKIVSIEMLEDDGPRYFDAWLRKCHALLKKTGILALQMITGDDTITTSDNRITELKLVSGKDLRLHYAATLKIWFMQFNSHLSEVRALGLDDQFIDKWNACLCSYESAFRKGSLHLMQLVYAPPDHIVHRDA